MTSNELIDFVRIKLAQGMSPKDIEEMLVSEGGWAEADVDAAFDSLETADTENPISGIGAPPPPSGEGEPLGQSSSVSPRKKRRLLFIIIGVVILIPIAVISLFVGAYFQSLSLARDKGADAQVKYNLHRLSITAGFYYSNNGDSYKDFCKSEDALRTINAAEENSSVGDKVSCHSNAKEWAAEIGLSGNKFYCEDYTDSRDTFPTSTISESDMLCG